MQRVELQSKGRRSACLTPTAVATVEIHRIHIIKEGKMRKRLSKIVLVIKKILGERHHDQKILNDRGVGINQKVMQIHVLNTVFFSS